MQFHPYSLLLAVACLIALSVAAYAWRRRPAPGAAALAVLNLALAEWAGTYAIMWASTSLAAQVFWLSATFLGAVVALPAILAFALSYAQQGHWLTPRAIALLAIHPALTVAILATDPWHHLFYAGYELVDRAGLVEMNWQRGPWFWITTGYGYVVLLAVVGLMVAAARRAPRLYRAQAGSVLLAVLFPWVANVFTQSIFRFQSELDLTPVAFSLSSLALAYGLYRHRLLDLVPVARGALIESMQDGVLVLDAQNRIVDINPAAQRVLPGARVGRPVAEVFSQYAGVIEHLRGMPGTHAEVEHGGRHYDLQILPLAPSPEGPGAPGRDARLVVWRDISRRRQAEADLQAANQRLHEQLEHIAALQARLVEEAIRDPLTGLYNRRYLAENMNRELSRAAREHYPVAVVVLDIDRFKAINDQLGHAAGDYVLRCLADLLRAHTRAGDLICRYGGEEFVVLLPNTSASQAAQRAEMWRAAFAEAATPWDGRTLQTTLSAGVADLVPPFDASPKDGAGIGSKAVPDLPPELAATADQAGGLDLASRLIHAAGLALYAAKSAGRNCIVAYSAALNRKAPDTLPGA
jgi:diguanylate cyclase (GGDEF)-like protein